MADEKEKPAPFFTQERVTLYAPTDKDTPHFKRGEKTIVQARQKDHFKKKGFTETPPAAKAPKEPKAEGENGGGPKTMTTK